MQQFVIDRSKWRTGGAHFTDKYGETQLLNEKGFMCCLGFFCVQIGNKTEHEIFDIALPETLETNEGIESLVTSELKHTEFTERVVFINDGESWGNEFREIQIHEQFKKINVDVKFVNEYPK